MAFQHKDNSGSLFRNDRKQSDNHPDYNGTAVVNGVEYWMNAWLKEGSRGKYFSFSFRAKEQRQDSYREQAQPVRQEPQQGGSGLPPEDDFSDQIPFAPCVD